MKRRAFITLLGGAATSPLLWPLTARAQQRALPMIGYLGNYGAGGASADSNTEANRVAFLKGLAEAGFAEGRDVAIDYRWIAGQNEKLPAVLDDLIARHAVVLAPVGSTAMALAAKAATSTVPIVFRIGGDPVDSGLVASFNRPGGNVTGITTLGVELAPKRLQMLREFLPPGATVALFANPTNANTVAETKQIEAAAQLLGVRLLVLDAARPSELDVAFEKIAQQQINGILNAADPFIISQRERIVAFAARRAIPAVYSARPFHEAGGLMFYGADADDGYRLAGTYVGRILKGEKPADLPVQQSTKVELGINLKVAKALGITIPAALLVRADEVIE